jgi:hypothetical protein
LPSYSFLQLPANFGEQSIDNSSTLFISLLAYAKADNVLRTDAFYAPLDADAPSTSLPELSCTTNANCGFYGIPVTSNDIQIVVDGSGSMSACVSWGSTSNSKSRTYYNGSSFSSTRRNCLVTRMESLQAELRNLIDSLPNTARISIRSFSSAGYLNNRDWNNGALMPLSNTANRTSALNFVNSLSDGDVTQWGGTNPWQVLKNAFNNIDSQSLYIMTDGDPNIDLKGGSWTSADYSYTSTNFLNINNSRSSKLVVNSVSIGQDSPWLKYISDGASGVYKMINQAYTAVQ